jgi:hypothetical protein
MAPSNRFEQAWAEAVARAWNQDDSAFREKLLRDPKGVFADLGAPIPENVQLTVVENTKTHLTFVVPPKPSELTDIASSPIAELYRACPGTVCAPGGSGGSESNR